jgi:hypothetical protein
MPTYPAEIIPNTLDLNPDLSSDKPSTNPLSYGTALRGLSKDTATFEKERQLYMGCMSQVILHP